MRKKEKKENSTGLYNNLYLTFDSFSRLIRKINFNNVDVYWYYIENVLSVEQEVHHIVYYLDSMDLVEHDRKVGSVVEDNKKKEQHNLKNIVDDIVEDVMEEVEVADEKYVELVMTKDIWMMEENNVYDNVNHLNYDRNWNLMMSSMLEWASLMILMNYWNLIKIRKMKSVLLN